MQSIRVAIPDDVAAKLSELAEREYRSPRQQASALLAEAIERARPVARRPARSPAAALDPEPVPAR